MAGRPPSKPAPTFGANLATLRKTRGLSQAKFAETLGISAHMLAYYERKAVNPSAEFVSKVAQVLNVPIDELLGHKALRKPGPPSQLEQRIGALRELPRERQKLVIDLIDTVLRDARKVG